MKKKKKHNILWAYYKRGKTSVNHKSKAKHMTPNRLLKFINTWSGSQKSGLMPLWIQPDALIYNDVTYNNMFVASFAVKGFKCVPGYLFSYIISAHQRNGDGEHLIILRRCNLHVTLQD